MFKTETKKNKTKKKTKKGKKEKKNFQKAPFKTGFGLSNKIFEDYLFQQKLIYDTQDYHNFAINRF